MLRQALARLAETAQVDDPLEKVRAFVAQHLFMIKEQEIAGQRLHDLVRFGMFHLGADLPNPSPILAPERVREMQEPTSRRADETSFYGIGWAIVPNPGGYDVVLSNSRGPDTLADLVDDLGPSARAATPAEAVRMALAALRTRPERVRSPGGSSYSARKAWNG